MGLYAIDCPECKKPFTWFSGNQPNQLCEECNRATPSQETLPDQTRPLKIVETKAIENSSNIISISYTNNNSLLVLFKNGGEYIYKAVPKEIYEEIVKAESAGKYLTSAVKGKYEYEKLDKAKSAELRTVKTLDTLMKEEESNG